MDEYNQQNILWKSIYKKILEMLKEAYFESEKF